MKSYICMKAMRGELINKFNLWCCLFKSLSILIFVIWIMSLKNRFSECLWYSAYVRWWDAEHLKWNWKKCTFFSFLSKFSRSWDGSSVPEEGPGTPPSTHACENLERACGNQTVDVHLKWGCCTLVVTPSALYQKIFRAQLKAQKQGIDSGVRFLPRLLSGQRWLDG